jgi:hypothetical protein
LSLTNSTPFHSIFHNPIFHFLYLISYIRRNESQPSLTSR